MLFDGGRVSPPGGCSQLLWWKKFLRHTSLDLRLDGYIKRKECTSALDVQGIRFLLHSNAWSSATKRAVQGKAFGRKLFALENDSA